MNARTRQRAGALTVAVVLLLSASAPVRLSAQRCPSGIRPSRAATITGAFVAIQAAAIAARQDSWWPGRPRSPHVLWGRSNSSGQDALLHGAITYQLSQGAALAWDWACAPRRTAGWLGAATAFAMGVPKELGDGIHANGFSGTDVVWSGLGAALPAVHRQWPATRLAQVKVWYWPSRELRTTTGAYPTLETDYAGQRFVLSLNPARNGGAGPWPDWLGVGIGHSTPSWALQPPSHQWFVTLDVDLRGLPVHTSWWPRVASVLDQVHVPAPGVRIARGRVEAGFF